MNQEDILRFSKNIKLNKFGAESQEQLAKTRVLVVGLGGLGLACASNLCANGVGTIGLADYDIVDISNLHRQVIYTTDQIGELKVEVAAQYIIRQNPNVKVEKMNIKVTTQNVEEIVKNFDIIVDCTDNISTHFLINDACFLSRKKLVCAGANEYIGFVFSVIPGVSHCYRCMYSNVPQAQNFCSNNPVYGPLINILGTIQASEVIKLATQTNNSLINKIITIDFFTNVFRTLDFERNASCPLCGQNASIKYIE